VAIANHYLEERGTAAEREEDLKEVSVCEWCLERERLLHRAPYKTTSGRDCVKSLRLCLHGTCPQRTPVLMEAFFGPDSVQN